MALHAGANAVTIAIQTSRLYRLAGPAGRSYLNTNKPPGPSDRAQPTPGPSEAIEENGMSRFARAVAFGSMMVVVALIAGPSARAADDDKEIKKAQQDVLDL